jgi:hypothetical protein
LSTNIPHKVLAFSLQDVENGLYKPEASTLHKLQHKPLSFFLTKQLSYVELWHKRMGHINFQGFHKLFKLGSSKGMSYMYVSIVTKSCYDYMLGKQHKKNCAKKKCRNPSLGFVTKERACKGAGQEGSPRVWENVKMNTHTPK